MKLLLVVIAVLVSCDSQSPTSTEGAASGAVEGSVGSRVFVVERASESLAIYDLESRRLLDRRIEGLGNMRHAVMAFAPGLDYAYVATRNGKLSRIDLATLERDADVFTSENSIDIAISQDGRYVATAEYHPGGITVLDAQTMEVVKRLPTGGSRATGVVDAPGNRFVAVTIEDGEIWIIDASGDDPTIEHRIPTSTGEPYDAMITPDGRFYLVGHMESEDVSVLDLRDLDAGVRTISLADPTLELESDIPVKLPHMASWAVAGDHAFVPLVGQPRLAVLDRNTWSFVTSIELRGHPVYAVRSPSEHEIWVSFSGEADDAFVQVVSTETLEVERTIEVGGRIYHMDFTPRGSHVLVTANRDDTLALVDATTYEVVDRETLASPSGVFGVWRAFRIGL